MSDEESDTYHLTITAEQAGHRADKAIAALCEDLSRTRIQTLIGEGSILLNHEVLSDASVKLAEGDEVVVDVPPAVAADPPAENIKLDIVYEDDDLLVINKAAGMVVHPGAGNYTGTLVNALLYHCGDSLSGIGGVARPGIVHRLDKDTSGLMIVAKNDSTHRHLTAQLSERSLSRVYHAIVLGVPVPPLGKVDLPIGRHPSNRMKMAVRRRGGGRAAVTHYSVQKNFGGAFALVECVLETGRTHQIRVHMEAAGHPLIGDQLYGPQDTAVKAALRRLGIEKKADEVLAFGRQALHAAAIKFIHPGSGEELFFEADPPNDFSNLLKLLNK